MKKTMFFIFLISISCMIRAQTTANTTPNKMDIFMQNAHPGTGFFSLTESLELVGIGISLETWRNHPDYPKFNVWKAINDNKGNYIISQELKQYPKTLPEWQMMSSKRSNDATEAAMREFMDRYPLPIAVVGPSWGEPEQGPERETSKRSNARSFVKTDHRGSYTARGSFMGLLAPAGQVMNSYLNDEPDMLWQTIFSTFDQNIDIPAVGVAAKDGAMHRALSFETLDKPRYEKLAAEQVYRPKNPRIISDNWTFLTMIRRGRIDRLRPYAPFVQDTMTVKHRDGQEASRNRSQFAGWKKPPPQPFIPTPYLPDPWTPFQIEQYDHLENLGTLYRPQVVSYLDDKGEPVKTPERLARFALALRAALAPLAGKLPERVIYDYGSAWDERSGAARFLPLVQGLQAIDAEFDLLDPQHGIDLSRVLGDTGAGSPFVGVAVAAMASKQSGGATLVANLRRADGATLLLITPPSAEQVARDAAIKRPYWPRDDAPQRQ